MEAVDVRVLAAGQQPDHRTIASFRARHLEALNGLFDQVLQLCREAGLVKLGHVAVDGTKVRANASKHKAMSYARMKHEEKRRREQIRRWFEECEATDAAADELYGRDKTGDELPEELRARFYHCRSPIQDQQHHRSPREIHHPEFGPSRPGQDRYRDTLRDTHPTHRLPLARLAGVSGGDRVPAQRSA